ncbi:viroplasmin family protein [Capnocytophaga sp.]|uniref:ribonuclease H1 domain-containing protein n=1 Tax=Capnocytophaga sp. TaxID=44737 RepID=UPI0026DD9AD3|nr:viroplasmin family protein [Capnocytophaga sp.]MDO5105937.1 viroplasmin family protein [Capnocytophaga sp.]
MAKKKFYVVWEGHKTGVFTSWEKCKKAVEGFPNAKYKSFPSLELAQKAFSESFEDYKGKTFFASELSDNELKRIGNPAFPSIAVDAACSGNPGVMEYRGVDTQTGKELFRIAPIQGGTNNIGEFLAIVHALALLKKHNQTIPIYSDSKIAINWVKFKKCKTNVQENDQNQKIFELIERAEIWLHQNTFVNHILKWETKAWGEIPADFGRKNNS